MLQMSRYQLALTTITLSIFGALPASAQTINEDIKLTASDAAETDWFGQSVGISGTTAIVGAKEDDDVASRSGSAYLFDTVTGQQLFKLNASDAEADDQFGVSVAISGTTAIVGAQDNDDVGSRSGSAYLFDTTTGQELFKLTASDAAPFDFFGWSVAISGTTAIVGGGRSGGDAGAAYLFDTVTGQELFKLTASDAAPGDQFSFSVAISGTTAIVGARLKNSDEGTRSGSAYVFDTITGQELFKLTASDAATDDFFGSSVAISGHTAIIGADGDDDVPFVSGAAYIFDTLTGLEILKLTASDAAAGDQFGISVAISDTTIIIGARGDNDGGSQSGSAYAFDTTTGLEVLKLKASDAAPNDLFGWSVAITGTTAIVGAAQDDDVATDSGSAYVFNTTTSCPADLTEDGVLDFLDVSLFVNYFLTNNPIADFNGDGIINFFDVSIFLQAFNAGCP